MLILMIRLGFRHVYCSDIVGFIISIRSKHTSLVGFEGTGHIPEEIFLIVLNLTNLTIAW